MKEKILAQLAAKYPGVSKQFLGLYADKLAAKVTEETQIEGAIGELDNLPVSITDLAAEFQREGDRRVTEATKNKPKPTPEPPAPQPTPPPADDTAALLQQLLSKVSEMEKKERTATLQQRLSGHEKLKAVPQSFYRGRTLPDKEEELDAFAESVAADFTAFQQETAAQHLSGGHTPVIGTPAGGASSVASAIKDWAASGKEPVKQS